MQRLSYQQAGVEGLLSVKNQLLSFPQLNTRILDFKIHVI